MSESTRRKPLRDAEGFWDEALLAEVRAAILHYPNTDAEQWLGAAAAVDTVARWIGDVPDE